MDADLVTAFVTLFVVIDPIGLAPLFVALTAGADPVHRRAVGLRACIIGAVILMAFGLLGESVLGFVGISLPAFRIAGGVLLFLTALDMLFDRRTKRRSDQHPNADDPSVFPLATPLIAGPGAIATMILLIAQDETHLSWFFAINAAMLAVVGVTLAFFLAADMIERWLGPVGINVVTRLFGMLLAALAVQFVIDGITATWGDGAAPSGHAYEGVIAPGFHTASGRLGPVA